MITNFEEITKELTDEELQLIPVMVRCFELHTKNNPIKAPEIVKQMNKYLLLKGIKTKMSEPRLRKCVNHIRSNSLIPLIATSEGYFVSYDTDIIKSQVKSLYQRAASIKKCGNGLNCFINKM